MDTEAFIRHITTRPGYEGQIAHIEHIRPLEADYGHIEEALVAPITECLEDNNLLPLYSHQAQAINSALNGQNVMVATSSASGKTLCYNIPVLQTLLTESGSRALYLFPTKALAQDQLRGLRQIFGPVLKGGEIDTFDGDTPPSDRAAIRRRARIVLTNPDMLHLGILPNHQSWAGLLKHLRYVVVDEAHGYRGVFGSHVATVLRRLKRLCCIYGSSPQFIVCSATVANPGEHARRLIDLPFTVVQTDGSPSGGKDFVFWNPPIIDEVKGTRGSANSESSVLFSQLVSRDIRTLDFTRSRRLTEIIYKYSRQRLLEENSEQAGRIKPYRAGYLARDRRRIEGELFGGRLTGVVATTALELGIDIGDLEATILTGYPGSIASTWQQVGRSGRAGGRSLSFLIALDNPLDQYFMRHPKYFFGKNYESALINPDNPYILKGHLLAAAWELPLTDEDDDYFGPGFTTMAAELEGRGLLKRRHGRLYISPRISYPAGEVNIRDASGENFALIDSESGALLETVETSHAFFQLHTGAIYLHQGESYLVTELDLASRTAYARPTRASYYTVAKDLTDIRVKKVLKSKHCRQTNVHLGEAEVTVSVNGFKKKAHYTEEVIGEESLDLPPQQFVSSALWFDIPAGMLAGLEKKGLDVAGGLHAAEHAAIGILPLFALCDRNDIGGVSTTRHPDTDRAGIFIYDAYPGGVGIAERGFELVEKLWRTTLQAIAECPCHEGCPSCIQSPKCGNNNKPLDKKAAEVILRGLLTRQPR